MGQLPQFTPRYFHQILQDMVNFIRTVAPELTDYNIGSIIRTILEAFAMEDDEQYSQMVNLSLLWNLDNVRGNDLDERLLEWNVQRFSALPAAGEVIVSNQSIVTSFLSGDHPAGSITLTLLSSAGFPTTGLPKTVRVDEKASSEEDPTYSANNISTNVLSLAVPLANDHADGARVSLVEGGLQSANAGTRIQTRPNPLTDILPATLLEDAVVEPGDYDSDPVLAIMDTAGSIGRVSRGAIEQFVGSPPFNGALVRNESPFTGGWDRESDDQFRNRGRKKLQSLGRGTPLSLEQLILGVEFTGLDGRTWRIISARVWEHTRPGCTDWVDLYVWPGAFDFVEVEQIMSPLEFTDPVAGAEDGQKFFRLPHVAIVPQSMVLQRWIVGGTGWSPMIQGTDYWFNEGTGWIRIVNPGLNKGDRLQVIQYNRYTGLLQEAQTVINGVASNPVIYPGIGAAGVKVLATYPRPAKLAGPIRAAIQVRDGFVEQDVSPLVSNEITRYLTEIRVGDDVILAEMIERSMGVEGMYNIQFSYPTGDIILLEDQVLDLENLTITIS